MIEQMTYIEAVLRSLVRTLLGVASATFLILFVTLITLAVINILTRKDEKRN